MKRGLSPIISVVLLIMLTMVVGSMVFLWARNTLKTSEEEALMQQECESIKLVLNDFCYEDVGVENIGTGDFEEKTRIKFNGRNDASEPELYGFLIFVDYEGSTISIPSSPYSEIEGYNSKSVATDFIEDIENVKQIRIAPKIKTQRKVFICEEKEVVVKWESVGEC